MPNREGYRGNQAPRWPLTPSEHKRIKNLLRRPPEPLELALFSALWSEHCSYKSSRHRIKELPAKAPYVLVGPGEDAGIIALPETPFALVLAMESHNHPSQVLPYEGAATGVGGIVRDVSCMGAEVIGIADALRFGWPKPKMAKGGWRGHSRPQLIADFVVSGISQYGNAIGVPNLGGDIYFDRGFNDNCLVNVVALGKVHREKIVHSHFTQEAPSELTAILIGKPTDYSGFLGAAFASKDLQGEDKASVQVPDPFVKNLLLHANMELFKTINAKRTFMKDLGAAGLAGALLEMPSPPYSVELALEAIPREDQKMPPEILLLAETQERFLLFVEPKEVPWILSLYNKRYALGDLYPKAGAQVIGRALRDGKQELRITESGRKVLTTPLLPYRQAPRLRRPFTKKKSLPKRPSPAIRNPQRAAEKVLDHPNAKSHEWAFRRYDLEVKGETVIRAGEADATVFCFDREKELGVALSVDGNPLYGRLDPYFAGLAAVFEAVRNVAAVGARPLALVDCLNFGNPERREVMGELVAAISGIRTACEQLHPFCDHPLPIVSGNVSLYNETEAQAIPPSPIVACVGSVHLQRTITPLLFQEGNILAYTGVVVGGLGGSLLAATQRGEQASAEPPPQISLEEEMQRIEALILAIEGGLVCACHDVSDGGSLLALAEMVECSPLGLTLDLASLFSSKKAASRFLFLETGGFYLEVTEENWEPLAQLFEERNLKLHPVGWVTKSRELRCTFQKSPLVQLTQKTILEKRQSLFHFFFKI